MLVLSRSIGESIVIGDDITVRVLGFHGHQVRIGIGAPVEICVDRSEIRDRRIADGTYSPQTTKETNTA